MNNIYVLDREKLDELLKEKGYSSYLDFCEKTGIHKNTLNYYLSGRDIFSKKLYEIAQALDVEPIQLIKSNQPRLENIEELEGILKELASLSGLAIILLGSRAKGSYSRYSDWDLGVTRSGKPLTGREFLRLRGRITDIADNLPRNVDLINLDASPIWFLETINYEPIFLAGSIESFHYFKGVLYGIKQRKAG